METYFVFLTHLVLFLSLTTLVFAVGLLGLDHSVSTTIEVMCAAIKSEVHLGHALAWFAAVLLGNIAGGVLITAVLNYGQVRAGQD